MGAVDRETNSMDKGLEIKHTCTRMQCIQGTARSLVRLEHRLQRKSVMRKETGEVDTGQAIEGIYISKTVSQVIVNQSG